MRDKSTEELVAGSHPAPPPPLQQAPMIFVPLDGSVHAQMALSVAQALAQLVGATLHLVHIGESTLPPRELLRKLGLAADDVRGAVVEQAGGDAAACIVRLARAQTCAYIVMCPYTGQREPVDGLGGVARGVLHTASGPIVLVPPAQDQRPWRLRHILLPHDGTPTTTAALGPALELARRADAELLVLHVAGARTAPPVEPGAITPPQYEDQAHHEWPTWAHEFLQRACYVNPAEEVRGLRLALTVGDPAAEIVHSARDNRADLIVLGWRGDLGGNHTLVAQNVIREMPCPLLILRASQRIVR
jgi:nucleotide-binding universal stress UspA family protein